MVLPNVVPRVDNIPFNLVTRKFPFVLTTPKKRFP